MLKDGTYAAWYQTPLDQGTGIVHVADGQIWGRDSVMTYHGSCRVDGDRFTATVSTKRHTDGRVTVFGVEDNLTLDIEGNCPGKIATYTAIARQVPGMILQGTLIFAEQQTPAPDRAESMPAFNPDKLPKLPRRSR
ncbi:hypothetical protein JQ580_29995 [Bradyrhizobium japonicum]|uniref:hypothetical protein n=1 Tax=Bradyrhizobium japonicum TaxID=375 RepID=UPI001BAB620B|nr:hypothetical protein [Bradyrhizobium japonicum]MBR0994948.1 hypothetical protein [Bradyrhizobium japonicum]